MRKVGVIIIAVILLAGVVYLLNTKSYRKEMPSLGEQIYTQTGNPLEEKIPNTNPFAAETNPAKKVYPNPFDRF